MTDLSSLRVVRLDAHLFPVDGFEREQWRRCSLRPVEAAPDTPGDLIRSLAGSVEAHQDVMRRGVENLAQVLCGRWPARENIINPRVEPRYPLSD